MTWLPRRVRLDSIAEIARSLPGMGEAETIVVSPFLIFTVLWSPRAMRKTGRFFTLPVVKIKNLAVGNSGLFDLIIIFG